MTHFAVFPPGGERPRLLSSGILNSITVLVPHAALRDGQTLYLEKSLLCNKSTGPQTCVGIMLKLYDTTRFSPSRADYVVVEYQSDQPDWLVHHP